MKRAWLIIALGLMPLQLLNVGPLVTLGYARALSTKTPRGKSALLRPVFS